jgi:hypothetical protein
MKHPDVFSLLLLLLLCSACKQNYTCTCDTDQIVYNQSVINGAPSSFTRNYSYREYNKKNAEKACFSSHAAETNTTSSPSQTTISTTTCSIQ